MFERPVIIFDSVDAHYSVSIKDEGFLFVWIKQGVNG